MFSQRISGILNKLESARRLPGSQDWFGVSKHQFLLRPPLPESGITAFETRHSVRLPDDYRQFLLLAGDGGAGPYYGVAPLAEWDFRFEEEAERPGFLASACPVVDGAAVRRAWKAAQERDARRLHGISNPGSAPGSAWEQFLPGDAPEFARGSIHLCDQGCTYAARLIVSGEARGRIIYLDVQGWYPPYFVRDLNFLDWYERWLDGVLTGTPPAWFGFDNPAYQVG